MCASCKSTHVHNTDRAKYHEFAVRKSCLRAAVESATHRVCAHQFQGGHWYARAWGLLRRVRNHTRRDAEPLDAAPCPCCNGASHF
jgi:hypothetical protein